MQKLIIFDWDDVIVLKAQEGWFACYKEALEYVGIYLSSEERLKRIIELWGKPYSEVLQYLMQENDSRIKDAIEFFEKSFRENTFIDQLVFNENTINILNILSSKYKLAVATGNTQFMINKIMQKFSIPNNFELILTSEEMPKGKSKPHPYMLQYIMKKLDFTKENTIFVGDAGSDAKMGLAAGVNHITVLTGQLSKQEAINLGVKHIINDLSELPGLVEKISLTM